MTSSSAVLLRRLHEQSQTEVIARAQAQFEGSSEEFLTLAEEYDTLAPRLRGRFLETLGLSSEDFESSQGTSLSLAVSAKTGKFLHNMVLSHQPARILELGSSCGVSTLYLAEALRTLGSGVVTATEADALKCAQFRANVKAASVEAYVDLWERDAFETVAQLEGTFDMVFIDVWANTYLNLFKQIERLLRLALSFSPTTCTRPRTPFSRTSATLTTIPVSRQRHWTSNQGSNLQSSFLKLAKSGFPGCLEQTCSVSAARHLRGSMVAKASAAPANAHAADTSATARSASIMASASACAASVCECVGGASVATVWACASNCNNAVWRAS